VEQPFLQLAFFTVSTCSQQLGRPSNLLDFLAKFISLGSQVCENFLHVGAAAMNLLIKGLNFLSQEQLRGI
jgi:hypothetical protein